MSGPDVGGSFLGLHHGGGSPRATVSSLSSSPRCSTSISTQRNHGRSLAGSGASTAADPKSTPSQMLSSPGFCPTSSVSSYTAPPSWQLDHLPSAPPRSPSPSFQPSPIPPTFALPIESSQSLEAVVASYITGSLVAQLETDESAGESDSDVDAFVKDEEEYDDGLIVTREETEEDEETEDEMGGVQEEAYQMWTYEDSIEDASARGLPGVDMAQDHAPYGEYDDDDDEVAVAGYPLHGHYGVEQGREQYQYSYARAALEQPQEDGNDSDDSYVPEGDFESNHSRDTPPTSTSSDIDGKHDLENQATLPAPSAFIPALSYPRSAHLKKAYVNENARDDDEYNNSIASTSSSRSSSRTTRGLPVSSTGSEQTPRSKPKAKSKPRMMDDGEPITRKRTEIPAVEDDPSIKPYGCCYPPCFDDRTGMVESGVPRKVTPWETNFRTIKELREHVAAKHKSGKPVVETPFRCALDPCGKTFKVSPILSSPLNDVLMLSSSLSLDCDGTSKTPRQVTSSSPPKKEKRSLPRSSNRT